MKIPRRRVSRAPSAKRLLSPKQVARVSSAELARTRGRINRSLARGNLRFYVGEAFAPTLAAEARARGWIVRIKGDKHAPDEKVLVFSLAPPTKRNRPGQGRGMLGHK